MAFLAFVDWKMSYARQLQHALLPAGVARLHDQPLLQLLRWQSQFYELVLNHCLYDQVAQILQQNKTIHQ